MPDDIQLPPEPAPAYVLPGNHVSWGLAAMEAYARAAVLADREAHGQQEAACLGLLADIRAAVGDADGRLTQPELLERIRSLAADGARLDRILRRIAGAQHEYLLGVPWSRDGNAARSAIDRLGEALRAGGPAA